jgi:hypothetical protein
MAEGVEWLFEVRLAAGKIVMEGVYKKYIFQ